MLSADDTVKFEEEGMTLEAHPAYPMNCCRQIGKMTANWRTFWSTCHHLKKNHGNGKINNISSGRHVANVWQPSHSSDVTAVRDELRLMLSVSAKDGARNADYRLIFGIDFANE